MATQNREFADEEMKTMPWLWTALITFAIMRYGAFAAWYLRAHPPYVWPVVPPPKSAGLSSNAYDGYLTAYSMIQDWRTVSEAYIVRPAPPKSPVTAAKPGGAPRPPAASASAYLSSLPTYSRAQIDTAAHDNLPGRCRSAQIF